MNDLVNLLEDIIKLIDTAECPQHGCLDYALRQKIIKKIEEMRICNEEQIKERGE